MTRAEGLRTSLGVFRNRGFVNYWLALLCTGFAVQTQTVAVGWQVYDITRDPFDLGLVGLSQFLPALVLVLVTGAAADRFPRRAIMGVCLLIMASGAAGLLLLTRSGNTNVLFIFALIAVFGLARAFYNPARQAIVANLVPASDLSSAITLNTNANHLATICGPVMGGLLYGLRPELAYGTSIALFACAALFILRMPKLPRREGRRAAGWAEISAGFRYIWSNKVVLGAISLDLFAVILGGAVALLPVFARDILSIGPVGLGILRAGPAIGAIAMGVALMFWPIRDNAGRTMFLAVAAFGAFTCVFALSETLWLSVLCLCAIGAADMVSVVIRGTLIQLWTPDELRGRVNAVNQVFIGASNEVGAFRAGSMAAVTGPVAAVALGGIGTLAVAALWFRKFPELATIRKLDAP